VVELRPCAGLAHGRHLGADELEVLHDTVLGGSVAAVAGDRDAEGAVGIAGHERRVLQADTAFERGRDASRPAVEDVGAGRGGNDDVLVAGAEISGDDSADDLARELAPPMDPTGGGTERVHRAGERPFDHLQIAVAEAIGQGRAAQGGAVELRLPHLVAVGVDGEDVVGVGRAGPIRARAEDDAGLGAREDVTNRRRRAHSLVDLVVAVEAGVGSAAPVSLLTENADLPAGDVVGAVGHAGVGVATLDDLVLTRDAFDIGDCRR